MGDTMSAETKIEVKEYLVKCGSMWVTHHWLRLRKINLDSSERMAQQFGTYDEALSCAKLCDGIVISIKTTIERIDEFPGPRLFVPEEQSANTAARENEI